MNVHRRVVVAVIEKAGGTPASRVELLEMLGAIDGDGRILPVDLQGHQVESLNNGLPSDRLLSRRAAEAPRPVNSTAPPALRNLLSTQPQPTPEPAVAKPVKAAKKKKANKPVKHRSPEAGSCGTSGGRMRHIRADQPVCQLCKTAHAEATRNYRLRRIAEGLPPRNRTTEYSNKKKRARDQRPAIKPGEEKSA